MLLFQKKNQKKTTKKKTTKKNTSKKASTKKTTTKTNTTKSTEKVKKVSVPILGKVNPKKVSLPILATVLGLVDGFNPCAMWVLLFLISMLLGMKNKKRMWTIGLTFLGSSALVYMLIML